MRMNKRQKKKKKTKERIMRQKDAAIIRIAKVLSRKRKKHIKKEWR